MNRRKEPCRNFQRGSCQYGDRCKFLHVTQQPSRPNPFGFGVQNSSSFLHTNQHQQKPNPFGFGVQNVSKEASTFGGKYQNQPQTFENKWTRSSSTAIANVKPIERTDAQLNVVTHKCMDPESCKRQIVEDFKEERPLWKLTCYGHSKNQPCDIVGDISYEELRAAAYEYARRGLTLESIVERERKLLNAKLTEFNNLLQNPYVILQRPGPTGPSLFHIVNHSQSTTAVQINAPPSLSSFSQPGASANLGPGLRSPATLGGTLGQPSPFQIPSETLSGFEMKFGTSGLPNGQSSLPFGGSGAQSVPSFNNGAMAIESNNFNKPPVQSKFFGATANLSSGLFDGKAIGQESLDAISLDNERELNSEDCRIWLKEEWEIGAIPEDEPPSKFCL